MMNNMNIETISFDEFLKVSMVVGTITYAELNVKAKKPAYKLTIDFGSMGSLTSSAQITENYSPKDLIDKQIVAVANFPPKRIAGVKSEVLVLAAVCKNSGTILIEPTKKVENGTRIL